MTEPAIIRTDAEGIVELVFNRPDKLNAINAEMLDIMREAVEDLRKNPQHRLMLIRSTGRYFSAGADLTNFPEEAEIEGAVHRRSWFRREMGGMQTLWQEMEMVEKPIVVAHHAMCVGGGLEMSLSCDFRFAAKSAGYWFPEMKMAMVPASGGLSRLTRLCGPHWAKWMVLANEKVSAERALIMGLVHEVFPDESFEEDVKAFCRRLVAQPPEATGIAKMAIDMAWDMDSANARQLERLVYTSLIGQPEHSHHRDQHHAKILKKE